MNYSQVTLLTEISTHQPETTILDSGLVHIELLFENAIFFLKGKYHVNSMSLQDPKNVCLLTETKNNCLVLL